MKKKFLAMMLLFSAFFGIKADDADTIRYNLQFNPNTLCCPVDTLCCNLDSLLCGEDSLAFHKAFESLCDTTSSALRTHWLSNPPGNNWFVSVEGGIDWFRSENWRDIEWKDRFRFTGGITFGRWFNPVWGLRMAISGGKYRSLAYPDYVTWYVGQNHPGPTGYSLFQTYVTYYDNDALKDFFNNRMFKDAKSYKNGWFYDFIWGEVTIDFMVNLRNLKEKYDPNRFFNPVMFVGVGYAHTFRQGELTAVNSIANRMGFQFNFRLNDHWDLYLTAPEVMMVPEVFDRQVGANQTQDLMINALLGLTYHFKNKKLVRIFDAPNSNQLDLLNDQINDLKNQLAAAELEKEAAKRVAENALLALEEAKKAAPTPLPVPPQSPAPVPPTPVPTPPAPVVPKLDTDLPKTDLPKKKLPLDFTPVFFTLDSYVVRQNQMMNIESAVEYLKENPEKQLTLAAYADIQTGNPKHNWTLSQNRVNAVAKVMIEKYKVDKDRLILKFYGDTEQPYEINENNRVVVFIK